MSNLDRAILMCKQNDERRDQPPAPTLTHTKEAPILLDELSLPLSALSVSKNEQPVVKDKLPLRYQTPERRRGPPRADSEILCQEMVYMRHKRLKMTERRKRSPLSPY